MILYGLRPSPFVRKVLLFAAEKGIALDLKPAGMGRGDELFEKASPFGKMPGFADEDFTICDSSAIVHYLDAKYPDPALIPAEPRARARTIWYDEFADTILFGTGRKLFWNRIVAPKVMKIDGDAAQADAAERDELPGLFTYLESMIPDSGFLVEDRLTLADIAVASPFINLAYCCPPLDGAAYPRICSWLSGLKTRPAFAAVLAAEKPMIDGMADRPELVV